MPSYSFTLLLMAVFIHGFSTTSNLLGSKINGCSDGQDWSGKNWAKVWRTKPMITISHTSRFGDSYYTRKYFSSLNWSRFLCGRVPCDISVFNGLIKEMINSTRYYFSSRRHCNIAGYWMKAGRQIIVWSFREKVIISSHAMKKHYLWLPAYLSMSSSRRVEQFLLALYAKTWRNVVISLWHAIYTRLMAHLLGRSDVMKILFYFFHFLFGEGALKQVVMQMWCRCWHRWWQGGDTSCDKFKSLTAINSGESLQLSSQCLN